MSDLGWRADGIERARAAGGIELELYRRPGFAGGFAVRRSSEGGTASGLTFDTNADPTPDEYDRMQRRKGART